VLDAAGVRPSKTGEAVEQRRGAGAACAEYGHALSLLHFEARSSQHPDARGASGDTGGVALPECASAKDDWHARTVHELDAEAATRRSHAG
jgi:hypothetical protein